MRTILTTLMIAFGLLGTQAQIYVQPGALGTGMTPESPIDLQSALNMASQGISNGLFLAEGVYTNTPYVLDLTGSDAPSISITGSFNPDYSDFSQDPQGTVLDAAFGSRVLDIIGTNTLSAQLYFEIGYLTIRNGDVSDANGAGIRADGGDPLAGGTGLSIIVQTVHFYDNICNGSGDGGAVWTNGIPVFMDCVFDGNEASSGGAMLLTTQGEGTQNGGSIQGCIFSNNLNFGNQGSTLWTNRYDFRISRSEFYGMDGGGSSGNGSCIWGNTGSYLKIYTCRFEGLRINYWGSAVQNWDSDIDIVNCLFKDNEAGINGGYGAYAYYHNNGPDREINIVQCSFIGNEGQNNVAWGAVQYRGNGADQLTAVNSLFWDNGNTPVVAEIGSASMSNCVTEFTPSGFSSTLDLITADPELINGYQFGETSVCTDAADELLNYIEEFSGLDSDIDGSPRRLSFEDPQILDIGAYEYNAPPTGIELDQFTPLVEGHSVPFTAGFFEALEQLGDMHTFELITGDGVNDADNDEFSIDLNSPVLKRNQFSDYEIQSEYHIYVRATDSQGQSVDQEVIVLVTNVNEQPTINLPLEDQTGTVGEYFDYELPTGSFFDVDFDDVLTYTTEVVGGGDLPDGLTFDGIDGQLYGIPTENGVWIIQVTATDLGGLSANDEFNLTIFPAVGLFEIENVGVDFYPNPVSDVLNVQIFQATPIILEIHNNTARLVYQAVMTEKEFQIDLSELARGAYSISIVTEDRRYISSFVKE